MIQWCLVDHTVTRAPVEGGLFLCWSAWWWIARHERTRKNADGCVWYSDVRCMIQWCLVYDTVMSGVWYSDVWCMIQWCLVYDTRCLAHHTVWYQTAITFVASESAKPDFRLVRRPTAIDLGPCRTSDRRSRYRTPNISVSYTRHHCIIHPTSLYHPRHQCIMHQTSLYHTPDITVLYATHHCITYQTLGNHVPQNRLASTLCHHCITHQSTMYHTPDITVSYTRLHCIIHQTSLYHTSNITSMHHTSMNQTPGITVPYAYHFTVHQTLYHTSKHHCHTPNKTVSYTKHHSITYASIALYRTPDFTVSHTKHHCTIHHPRCIIHHRCIIHQPHPPRRQHVDVLHILSSQIRSDNWTLVYTMMSGVWYNYVWCMIQWCLVYDTIMSGVWYSDVWYCDVSCMIEWCLVYDTVMSGVWYSDV